MRKECTFYIKGRSLITVMLGGGGYLQHRNVTGPKRLHPTPLIQGKLFVTPAFLRGGNFFASLHPG